MCSSSFKRRGKRWKNVKASARSTGRRVGADYVATGDLLRFGSTFKLDLRLYETAQGRLLGGAQASGRSADELDERTPAAVAALLSGIPTLVMEARSEEKPGKARETAEVNGVPPLSDDLAPTPDV